MHTYVIVDDESLTREGTIKKLMPLSDTVTCVGEASDGEEALALIARADPDIIITDMNMPIMDGTEFLPLLTKSYPGKQIVVISGYKDFEYTKQAIVAKAVNYILKPFGREEIQSAVLHAVRMIDDRETARKEIVSSEEEKEAARYEYDIQLLKNIILGYDVSSARITSQKLKFIDQTHSLIMITLSSGDSVEEDDQRAFLQEAGFGNLALYLPHMRNGNLGFLVLFLPERAAITPNELCRQVIQSLSYRLEARGKNVLFGISRPHSGLSDLHTAFEETVSVLNARRLSDGSRSLFYQGEPEAIKTISWGRSDELLFRIEAGMQDQVRELLDELFRYFPSIPSCTVADVKYYFFQLTGKVKEIMTYYFEQVRQYSVPTSLQSVQDGFFSLEEIRGYYVQMFTNIAGMLKTESVYATERCCGENEDVCREKLQKQRDRGFPFLSVLHEPQLLQPPVPGENRAKISGLHEFGAD